MWQQISLQGGELTLHWSQQEGLRLLPGAQTGATLPPQELLA
jgi:hypothetical protein